MCLVCIPSCTSKGLQNHYIGHRRGIWMQLWEPVEQFVDCCFYPWLWSYDHQAGIWKKKHGHQRREAGMPKDNEEGWARNHRASWASPPQQYNTKTMHCLEQGDHKICFFFFQSHYHNPCDWSKVSWGHNSKTDVVKASLGIEWSQWYSGKDLTTY